MPTLPNYAYDVEGIYCGRHSSTASRREYRERLAAQGKV